MGETSPDIGVNLLATHLLKKKFTLAGLQTKLAEMRLPQDVFPLLLIPYSTGFIIYPY